VSDVDARLVVGASRRLEGQLRALGDQRIVFFAGLPGTGKSLLVHQLAHLADQVGRHIQLMQWDVARPAFEASSAGRRYPLANGVTHPVIRKAAGLWARRALSDWDRQNPGPENLLIGETPFVGNRFAELARPLDDAAEPLLGAASCRFAIAVPSAEVRRFLEAERERRAAHPLHPREREDAPPHVLRDLWRDLAGVASRLGISASALADETAGPRRAAGAEGGAGDASIPYDPVVYRRVYERILRHRHADVVDLDAILPTRELSVYDFAVAVPDLAPTEAEAVEFIREVEQRYPDPGTLDTEIAHWWE